MEAPPRLRITFPSLWKS